MTANYYTFNLSLPSMANCFQSLVKAYYLVLDCLTACQSVLIVNVRFLTLFSSKICDACNFTKINTPPWVFFTFFKLYKCYQIAHRVGGKFGLVSEVNGFTDPIFTGEFFGVDSAGALRQGVFKYMMVYFNNTLRKSKKEK